MSPKLHWSKTTLLFSGLAVWGLLLVSGITARPHRPAGPAAHPGRQVRRLKAVRPVPLHALPVMVSLWETTAEVHGFEALRVEVEANPG